MNTCLNCGRDYQEHHYHTNACPVGYGENKWSDNDRFQSDTYVKETYRLRETVNELQKRIAELESENAKLKSQSRRRKLIAEQGHDY